MKKGDIVKNIGDKSMDITIGNYYTLIKDCEHGGDVSFNDDDGVIRSRFSPYYVLVTSNHIETELELLEKEELNLRLRLKNIAVNIEILNNLAEKLDEKLKVGDRFVKIGGLHDSKEYILTEPSFGKYSLISLSLGVRWAELTTNISEVFGRRGKEAFKKI